METEICWDTNRLTAVHAQPDKAARVRRMFDAIAPTYELINTLASGGRDRAWRRRMGQLAAVRPDDVMLDVACGTGDVVRVFAGGRVRPARIIGLDFSRPMLTRAARRPVRDAHFCQADALRLPLADGCVSLLTCAFGIRNFQDLDAALGEMYRVLGNGGRAIILEFTVPRRPLFRRLYLCYINHFMPRLARLISGDRTGAYRYLPSSVLSFGDGPALTARLRFAGFAQITAYPSSGGMVAIYVALKNT